MRRAWLTAGGLIFLAVLALHIGRTYAASTVAEGQPPATIDLQQCQFRILAIDFARRIETDLYRETEREPDKFRYAIVTAEIRKPAGAALELCAADISLHYWRSNGDYDVAFCRALSQMSTRLDEDRLLRGALGFGPGWAKVRTRTATRRASRVYVDLVFPKIESDIQVAWLFVGQPIGEGLACEGW